MLHNPQKTLKVTAVRHTDGGMMTAFLTDLPAIVVQGTNDEEVFKKLDSVLGSYVNYINNMKSSSNNMEIQTQLI